MSKNGGFWSGNLKFSAVILILLTAMGSMVGGEILPKYFLSRQDMPVMLVTVVMFLWFAWHGRPSIRKQQITLSPSRLFGAMLAIFGVGLAGHYLIFSGYAFSRDEQMALFDAEIYSNGALVARIPEYWAEMHGALNLAFIPASLRGEGWISSYRPVNGFMHMLMGQLGNPLFTNPLLTAVGLFATWRVSIRFWPQEREAQFVAVILYCLSAQVLVTGMTSYAMPGHLAFNMVWLMLFLHNRWYSHLGALIVGILAVGMHQLVYHPLFAGPVLFCLLLQRRWGLAGIYAGVYASAILFWTMWLKYPVAELGVTGVRSDTDGYIGTRVGWALTNFSPEYLWIKAENMLRFFAWQHLLLLPLMLVGARAMLRSKNKVQIALIGSLIALLIFKLILRPYQGHGWGYRYMHGLIGICCLMGAAGWIELRRRGLANMRQFMIASVVTAVVAMPWLMWKAHVFSGNFADLDAKLSTIDSDIVIVEDRAVPFGKDVVYNPPYLDARPIRLMASLLQAEDMAKLCARYSVSFVGYQAFTGIAGEFSDKPEHRYGDVGRLKKALPGLKCDVRVGFNPGPA